MQPKYLSEKQKRLISRGALLALWACLGLASFALFAGFKLWHIVSALGFEQYRYIGVAGVALGAAGFLWTALVLARALIVQSRPGSSKSDADA